jgi:hypothetical protein
MKYEYIWAKVKVGYKDEPLPYFSSDLMKAIEL